VPISVGLPEGDGIGGGGRQQQGCSGEQDDQQASAHGAPLDRFAAPAWSTAQGGSVKRGKILR